MIRVTQSTHSFSLSYQFYCKNQILNLLNSQFVILYVSEISLFKVLIALSSSILGLVIWLCWDPVCKLNGKMPIDWSFFLVVWRLVNSFSVSVTDWNLSSPSIQWVSGYNKSLALHWWQNSCTGKTLTLLVFSCWVIRRVITSSPLT